MMKTVMGMFVLVCMIGCQRDVATSNTVPVEAPVAADAGSVSSSSSTSAQGEPTTAVPVSGEAQVATPSEPPTAVGGERVDGQPSTPPVETGENR